MGKNPKRWGHGRVGFIADLTSIRADLSRAIPLTEIFAVRKDKLGITYSAFCKLVARYAADARIKPSEPTQPDATPTQSIAGPDGHQSPTRTFDHKPQVSADDAEQLLGPIGKRRR